LEKSTLGKLSSISEIKRKKRITHKKLWCKKEWVIENIQMTQALHLYLSNGIQIMKKIRIVIHSLLRTKKILNQNSPSLKNSQRASLKGFAVVLLINHKITMKSSKKDLNNLFLLLLTKIKSRWHLEVKFYQKWTHKSRRD
jgi:hypothetical protein